MQVPELLCGDTRSAASACRKQVTSYVRGGAWLADVTLVELDAAPGLILLNGSSAAFPDANVHAYAPLWELARAVDGGRLPLADTERAFAASLATPWAILGLLSQQCYRWLDDDAHAQRFLAAMITHWPALDAAGPRYTMGSRTGAALWDLPHLLKYVLARRGVAQPRLLEPLPAGGLAALAGS